MSSELLIRKERRKRQVVLIESEEREMLSLYSAYRNAKTPKGRARPRYVVDIRFGYYSQYVRKDYSGCDVTITWTE